MKSVSLFFTYKHTQSPGLMPAVFETVTEYVPLAASATTDVKVPCVELCFISNIVGLL